MKYHLGSVRSSIPMEPTFHKFRDLPTELRIQIWEEVAMLPRVVELVTGASPLDVKFRSSPSLLRTCKESREVALPIYRGDSILEHMGAKTHFNYDRDILYFPDNYFFYLTWPKQSRRRRWRALRQNIWAILGSPGSVLHAHMERQKLFIPQTGVGGLQLDTKMFAFLCETAGQVKNIGLSIPPNYNQYPMAPYLYEMYVETAFNDFRRLAKHGGTDTPTIPSVTLIPGDVRKRRAVACIVDHGAPTGIIPIDTMGGGLRRTCLCIDRTRRCRMYALDAHLQQDGLPIPDRSNPCVFDENGDHAKYDFEVRVATISRMADEKKILRTTNLHGLKLKSLISSAWRKKQAKTSDLDGKEMH